MRGWYALLLVSLFCVCTAALRAQDCSSHDECGPGEYCQKVFGDCDGPGICTPTEEACLPYWEPVCGCDGIIYTNEGCAQVAGVNLTHTAVCCPGDLNDDWVVEAEDLAIVLGNWGACPGCPADINGDGVVGPADLAIVLGKWGSCFD